MSAGVDGDDVGVSWVAPRSRSSYPVPPSHPPRLARCLILVSAVGFVGFAASTFLRSHSGHDFWFDTVGYDGLQLLSASIAGLRALQVRAERRAWFLLAFGMLVSGLGDVIYAAIQTGDSTPTVTLADPFYLAFYPCAYVGLLFLVRSRVAKLPAAVILDGLAAGLMLFGVTAAIVFGPISAATGGSPLEVFVGLAYPVSDFVLLAIPVACLVLLGRRAGSRWLLIAAGVVVFGVGDVLYLFHSAAGSYVEGTWLDTLWPAGFAILAFSAWRPTRHLRDQELTAGGSLGIPMVCTLASVAVLVIDHNVTVPLLAVVSAGLALLAVAARLAVTIREVRALADSHVAAATDELTGVANRRALLARLSALPVGPDPDAIAGSALLLVDLDRFKEINDTMGHHVGDELLRQLARRLVRAIGPGDLLARLGGDEFAVLLDGESDLQRAELRAQRMIASLTQPFTLDDITLHLSASVGIALCPLHCTSPMQLLQRADVAMYSAKRTQEKLAVYAAADDPYGLARLQTVEELRAAIGGDELTCHYQPKVRLRDGRVESVEALVRWQHPTRGLLFPDAFVGLAEQSALMGPLTERVLGVALAQCREWRDSGLDLRVAVNLSVTNLLDSNLPVVLDRLLAAHGLPPASLILEITETVLMADSVRARSILSALRDLGVGLAVDDYGTGYSSLAYLQDLPVDELKLDRAFVSRLTANERSAAIVRSTVDLAHSLGLLLVAEGVEDQATVDALRSFGCDISQGYHHSRPVPAEALAEWLRARETRLSKPKVPARALRSVS